MADAGGLRAARAVLTGPAAHYSIAFPPDGSCRNGGKRGEREGSFLEVLRYGSSGPMVEYLQLALRRAGYDPGNIDGLFGWHTQAALTRFQRAGGLAADGVVGRLTWARLFPYLAGYTVHVARAGDTFFSLAARYGTSAAAIAAANPSVQAEAVPVGAQLVVPLGFALVPFEVSYTYALVSLLLDGLAARYPFLARQTIGSSVLGREIMAVRIGEGAREVCYNAAHHGNEWITAPVLLRYLEEYAAAYAAGGQVGGWDARTLYARASLFLVPLVNPDGVDLVTGGIRPEDAAYEQARALSTFYPDIPFPSGWKANIAGTDLNLGYPAGWEQARAIKYGQGYTRPGPRDYVGSAPLAEPENRAMAAFTQAHDFLLTLSYHTQGGVIYWKYLDEEPPGGRRIAEAFAGASGYLVEDTPYSSGFAGYKDWFILAYNRPGCTIEAGRGQNPLPLAQLPQIYRENVGILTLGMVLS